MRKLTTLLFAGIFSFGLYTTAQAQISVGAGIAYGTNIEEVGLQASGTYVFNEDMRFGADFIYWLTESNDFFDMTAIEFNANFNYIFYNENDLIVYGIGTLGLHYVKVSSSVNFGEFGGFDASASDTELGLGIGAGLEYNAGPVVIYVEPRLFLSGLDQLSLAAGVRLPIN